MGGLKVGWIEVWVDLRVSVGLGWIMNGLIGLGVGWSELE